MKTDLICGSDLIFQIMNVIYVKRFHGTGKICSMYSLNKNYNEIKKYVGKSRVGQYEIDAEYR